MKILINKVRWSLRRFIISIPKDALVLEVESVGDPYPRSNEELICKDCNLKFKKITMFSILGSII